MKSLANFRRAKKDGIDADLESASPVHFSYPLIADQLLEPLTILCTLRLTFAKLTVIHQISVDCSIGFRAEAPVSFRLDTEEGEIGLHQQMILAKTTAFAPGEHLIPVILQDDHSLPPNEGISRWPANLLEETGRISLVRGYRFKFLLDSGDLIQFDFGRKGSKKHKRVPFTVVSNPSHRFGELPAGFEITKQNFLENFGLYKYSVVSDCPTIASLFTFRLELFGVPTNVNIIAMRGSILQEFVWTSPKNANFNWTSNHKFTFLDRSGTVQDPFRQLASGGSLFIEESARLPHDESGLLPSTVTPVSASQCPAKVSHQVILELELYYPETERRVVISVKDQIQLASCMCLAEAVSLPLYTAEKPDLPSIEDVQPLRLKDDFQCVCGFDLPMLLSRWTSSATDGSDSSPQTPELPPKMLPS